MSKVSVDDDAFVPLDGRYLLPTSDTQELSCTLRSIIDLHGKGFITHTTKDN